MDAWAPCVPRLSKYRVSNLTFAVEISPSKEFLDSTTVRYRTLENSFDRQVRVKVRDSAVKWSLVTWRFLRQFSADEGQTAKYLMVGAGGIGCELLKTLVLAGFQHIHVIDMDTIEVAREALLKLRPDVDIVSHHANVKSSQFDIFQQSRRKRRDYRYLRLWNR